MRNQTIIDKDFKIRQEDPKTLTIVFSCLDDKHNRKSEWRIRADTEATYTAWLHMIKQAKRPIWDPINVTTCRKCSAKFTFNKR